MFICIAIGKELATQLKLQKKVRSEEMWEGGLPRQSSG